MMRRQRPRRSFGFVRSLEESIDDAMLRISNLCSADSFRAAKKRASYRARFSLLQFGVIEENTRGSPDEEAGVRGRANTARGRAE